ncbi:unnamed protein product [Dicrocoelium dendriticum]|nr:unnamed protein product [Dicrocoelium dendriticum]
MSIHLYLTSVRCVGNFFFYSIRLTYSRTPEATRAALSILSSFTETYDVSPPSNTSDFEPGPNATEYQQSYNSQKLVANAQSNDGLSDLLPYFGSEPPIVSDLTTCCTSSERSFLELTGSGEWYRSISMDCDQLSMDEDSVCQGNPCTSVLCSLPDRNDSDTGTGCWSVQDMIGTERMRHLLESDHSGVHVEIVPSPVTDVDQTQGGTIIVGMGLDQSVSSGTNPTFSSSLKGNRVRCSNSVSAADSVLAAASAALANFHHRGSLQLWQFLVALLDDSKSSHLISWTGRTLEFKLNEPEEVARLWGIQKNRPAMNYDKLSRSLRYYYEKGIMQKVSGERYVYRFVYEPELLFALAFSGEDPQQSSSNMAVDGIKHCSSFSICNGPLKPHSWLIQGAQNNKRAEVNNADDTEISSCISADLSKTAISETTTMYLFAEDTLDHRATSDPTKQYLSAEPKIKQADNSSLLPQTNILPTFAICPTDCWTSYPCLRRETPCVWAEPLVHSPVETQSHCLHKQQPAASNDRQSKVSIVASVYGQPHESVNTRKANTWVDSITASRSALCYPSSLFTSSDRTSKVYGFMDSFIQSKKLNKANEVQSWSACASTRKYLSTPTPTASDKGQDEFSPECGLHKQ